VRWFGTADVRDLSTPKTRAAFISGEPESTTRASAGESTRTVADYLNEIRIPAGNREKDAAKRWTPGRITNLIKNPIYRGVFCRNKRAMYIDPDDPRQVSRQVANPKSK
jgi:hypothetical protein